MTVDLDGEESFPLNFNHLILIGHALQLHLFWDFAFATSRVDDKQRCVLAISHSGSLFTSTEVHLDQHISLCCYKSQ